MTAIPTQTNTVRKCPANNTINNAIGKENNGTKKSLLRNIGALLRQMINVANSSSVTFYTFISNEAGIYSFYRATKHFLNLLLHTRRQFRKVYYYLN